VLREITPPPYEEREAHAPSEFVATQREERRRRKRQRKLRDDLERALGLARELRPDLWARTEAVARIIDPSAFADDWVASPPEAARTHALKLKVLRGVATRRAQDVLEYLGVNTETDWGEVLARLAEE